MEEGFGKSDFDVESAVIKAVFGDKPIPDVAQLSISELAESCKAAVAHLEQVAEEAASSIERLDDDMSTADTWFRRHMADLDDHATSITTSVIKLEKRIDTVDSTPVGVGDRLEQLHRQMGNLEATHQLLVCFAAFNSESKRLPAVLDPDTRDIHKAAGLCRDLRQLAEQLQGPETERGVAEAQQYCNELEVLLLDRFCNSLSRSPPNLEETREYAGLLQRNFGSVSCRQYYVQLNSFFAAHPQKQNTKLPFSDRLKILFEDIEELFEKEQERTRQIFVDPQPVMEHMILRVMETQFADRLQEILEEARKVDDNGYQYLSTVCNGYRRAKGIVERLFEAGFEPRPMLQSLESAFHTYTTSFLDWELQSIDGVLRTRLVGSLKSPQPHQSQQPQTQQHHQGMYAAAGDLLLEHLSQISSANAKTGDRSAKRTFLLQAVTQDFVARHRSSHDTQHCAPSPEAVQVCVQWASEAIGRLYDMVEDAPVAVCVYFSRVLAALNDYLALCIKLGVESTHSSSEDNMDITSVSFLTAVENTRACLIHVDALMQRHIQPKVETGLNTLAWSMEEYRQLCVSLETLILSGLSECILLVCRATTALIRLQPKQDYSPDMQSHHNTNNTHTNTQSPQTPPTPKQQHQQHQTPPQLSHALSKFGPTLNSLRSSSSSAAATISASLLANPAALLATPAALLASLQQTPNTSIVATQTRTGLICCALLNGHVSLVRAHLTPKNVGAYVSQLVMLFQKVLFEHMTQQTISIIGSFVLQMDLLGYEQLIESWKVPIEPRVMHRFSVLKEVPKLLSVDPENLLSLLGKETSSPLAAMGRPELLAWLKTRPDFSKARIASLIQGP
eukprot:c8226_g1_i1.p1 GENE.c8226_g1_i1~~c8226_g1_i1.p1  ORF type:complete len:858 (+),score=225.66 c8226_g1_i1:35-2575(+)